MSATNDGGAKLVVGQRVFSLNIGNSARHCEQVLTPTVVRKVGRKFFHCSTEDWPEGMTRFFLSTMHEDANGYCSNQRIYINAQEWTDQKERADICGRIYKAFEYGRNSAGLSLEQLRSIDALLRARTAGGKDSP